MEFSAAFLLALRALGRNKMRSSLTMLGMIIGVGAVIAVIGIGQGAAAKAQEQLAALGSNMLMVGSGSVNRGGLHTGHGQTKTLVIADAGRLSANVHPFLRPHRAPELDNRSCTGTRTGPRRSTAPSHSILRCETGLSRMARHSLKTT